MNLLVGKLHINNLPVCNHLIEKLNHHILCGLLSKNQLKRQIVQQISIFKIQMHKNLILNLI